MSKMKNASEPFPYFFLTVVWRQEAFPAAHCWTLVLCAGAEHLPMSECCLPCVLGGGVAELSCCWLQNNFFYGRKLLICTFSEE